MTLHLEHDPAAPAAPAVAAPPARAATKPHSPRNVLVLGATSGIGRAVARRFAAAGDNVILAARDAGEAGRTAADLRLRYGVEALAVGFEATAFDALPAAFASWADALPGGLWGVVLCHGYMAEQADAERDFALARRMIDTNYTSAVCLLNLAADYLEQRGKGCIVAVSSVAGDRGRQSNYLYGSSKAALSVYAQGLRSRLAKKGVHVLTVKPGFVDTAMTWGRPGVFLVASPDKVADDVFRAARKGRDQIYTPWFWLGIMSIIKSIPERVFKRMKL